MSRVPWHQLDRPAACLWLILSISSCSSASSSFFSTSSCAHRPAQLSMPQQMCLGHLEASAYSLPACSCTAPGKLPAQESQPELLRCGRQCHTVLAWWSQANQTCCGWVLSQSYLHHGLILCAKGLDLAR